MLFIEKSENMFATLVIQLPSNFSGGDLTVRHGNDEVKYECSKDSTFSTSFYSFYTDCEHNIAPVTRGYRLCLIYNICYMANKSIPKPSGSTLFLKDIEELIDEWEDKYADEPLFLYMLDHYYTQFGLRFDCLKGTDNHIYRHILNYNTNNPNKQLEVFMGIFKMIEQFDVNDESMDIASSSCTFTIQCSSQHQLLVDKYLEVDQCHFIERESYHDYEEKVCNMLQTSNCEE